MLGAIKVFTMGFSDYILNSTSLYSASETVGIPLINPKSNLLGMLSGIELILVLIIIFFKSKQKSNNLIKLEIKSLHTIFLAFFIFLGNVAICSIELNIFEIFEYAKNEGGLLLYFSDNKAFFLIGFSILGFLLSYFLQKIILYFTFSLLIVSYSLYSLYLTYNVYLTILVLVLSAFIYIKYILALRNEIKYGR